MDAGRIAVRISVCWEGCVRWDQGTIGLLQPYELSCARGPHPSAGSFSSVP